MYRVSQGAGYDEIVYDKGYGQFDTLSEAGKVVDADLIPQGYTPDGE